MAIVRFSKPYPQYEGGYRSSRPGDATGDYVPLSDFKAVVAALKELRSIVRFVPDAYEIPPEHPDAIMMRRAVAMADEALGSEAGRCPPPTS